MKVKNTVLSFSLVLISLLALLQSSTVAAKPFPADTTIRPRKPHKLNQQQFLDRYGTDDSSRAFIRYYFSERQTAVRLSLYSGASLVLAGLLAGVTLSNSNGIGDGWNDFFVVLISLASAYAAALLLLAGTLLLLLQSRKRLYRLSRSYQQGNGLPRSISRKKSFLRLLKKEQLK